jgi:hypothetical protein
MGSGFIPGKELAVSWHNYQETVQMNVETTITKKGGNDKVSGCSAIKTNGKKFSPKEAPDAAPLL